MSGKSIKKSVGSTHPRESGGSTTTWPVISVGASAGGLDASQKLLDALADHDRCALVVIQHLEPHHDSLMVELLVPHTAMPVLEATEGMLIEIGHVYVILPGSHLAVRHGAFHLSKPPPSKGTRLVLDAFLNSLAVEYPTRRRSNRQRSPSGRTLRALPWDRRPTFTPRSTIRPQTGT